MEQAEKKEDSTLEKEAEIVANPPITVKYHDGRGTIQTAEVYKCKLKQLAPVLRLVSEVLKSLGFTDITDTNAQDDLIARTNDPGFILQLIANSADDVMKVASTLCSLSEDELGDLDLDDATVILLKVWEVNESFFLQKVLPMLKLDESGNAA